MKHTFRVLMVLAVALVWLSAMPGQLYADGTSSTNGVYGGYIGSSTWFADEEQSGANQAMMQDVAGTADYQRLPAGYVEFAGLVTFPHGNPFPGGELPDLRIRCRNQQADPVERAPFLGKNGSFYTIFQKGQTYDLYWMYYFGAREKFATIYIAPRGSSRRARVFTYSPARTSDSTKGNAQSQPAPQRHQSPPHTPKAPPDANTFDLSGFPKQPTTFEEQQILDNIQSATTPAFTPAFKADAHQALAAYYQAQGDARRAKAEYAKAAYWRAVAG